jgi:hypothetical protein
MTEAQQANPAKFVMHWVVQNNQKFEERELRASTRDEAKAEAAAVRSVLGLPTGYVMEVDTEVIFFTWD